MKDSWSASLVIFGVKTVSDFADNSFWMFVMCFVINYKSFFLFVGRYLLALMVHLIDSDFKLREILIFAKPFYEVSHTVWEIEKAIKTGLANFGIGKYELSKTLFIDTLRLCYVVFLINGIDFVLVHAHVLNVDAVILSDVFSFCSYLSLRV